MCAFSSETKPFANLWKFEWTRRLVRLSRRAPQARTHQSSRLSYHYDANTCAVRDLQTKVHQLGQRQRPTVLARLEPDQRIKWLSINSVTSDAVTDLNV